MLYYQYFKPSFNKLILILLMLSALLGCSPKLDPVSGEREVFEPNANVRADKFARENPIISFGGRKSNNNEFEFASSNVLWRATLKSLDFLPMLNADYSGGIIIYDWYSQTNNPKEQIKISVQFLNNELRSDSVKIIAHKKICETAERCSNSTLDQKFANSIKDSIIASARALKIEEAKKEKK
jgi:hypothetical protein